MGIDASDREATIIVPTTRTWYRPHLRTLVDCLCAEAHGLGRDVAVVSPIEVRRQPRLGGAECVLRSMKPPAAGDASTLARSIAARGGAANLATCAAALPGPYALDRIFGLMAGGLLSIDLDIELGAESIVRLREASWPFPWDALGWRSARQGQDIWRKGEPSESRRRH
ncbi:hypothetical protein [Methylobacterium segetis]|uniref:hypothetical protein n=1 Tax=Methylobacterium segetis TaxID=2488750 RepID=UPI00104E7650|nr:hypothetical protein [Methylobacterium segetis]